MEYCPNAQPLVLRNIDNPDLIAWIAAPAKEWDCGWCLHNVLLPWYERDHQAHWSALSIARVDLGPADSLASARRRVHREGGEYRAVPLPNGATILYTNRPWSPTLLRPVEDLISVLPEKAGKSTSSSAWALVKSPTKWAKIGKSVRAKRTDVVDLVERMKVRAMNRTTMGAAQAVVVRVGGDAQTKFVRALLNGEGGWRTGAA